MSQGGASVNIGEGRVRDSRVNKFVAVGVTVISGSVLAIGAWIANSIGELNRSVATLVEQNRGMFQRLEKMDERSDRQDMRDDLQDTRINMLQGEVSELKGRNMRGPHSGDRR